MSRLSDAIELLMAKGKERADGLVFAGPVEPEHVYYIRRADGELMRVEAAQKPIKASAFSVGGLVDAAELLEAPLAVWYSRHEVLLVGGKERRQLVQFLPTKSPQIELLESWTKAKIVASQKEMITLLKVHLADCFEGGYLDAVRAVKFEVIQQGASEIRQGKASIGKQLTAQLTGSAELPEVLVFRVPAFTRCLQARRYEVRVSLDVDAEANAFRLQTLPTDVERAYQWAEADLADMIGKELNDEAVEAEVIYGQPSQR